MNVNAPGRKMLKVVGILCIIYSGLNILVVMYVAGAAGALDAEMPLANVSWSMYYGMILLVYLYTLFMGIMGIVHSKNPARAKFLAGLGLGSIAAHIIFYLVVGFEASSLLGVFWLIPVDFVLPVLFIIGAVQNIKAQ